MLLWCTTPARSLIFCLIHEVQLKVFFMGALKRHKNNFIKKGKRDSFPFTHGLTKVWGSLLWFLFCSQWVHGPESPSHFHWQVLTVASQSPVSISSSSSSSSSSPSTREGGRQKWIISPLIFWYDNFIHDATPQAAVQLVCTSVNEECSKCKMFCWGWSTRLCGQNKAIYRASCVPVIDLSGPHHLQSACLAPPT